MSLKRCFDILASALGLLLLSPLMAWIALRIGLQMGRPILFRQERTGLGGESFVLLKFRTMEPCSGPVDPSLDEQRITPLGLKLRESRLDELPNLWNVLKGDMSLVGPRPLLSQYTGLYTPEQARRHQVLPGITGWAQLHDAQDITWEERFAYDLWYLEHRSLALDLKILWRTLLRLWSPGRSMSRSMPLFRGAKHE